MQRPIERGRSTSHGGERIGLRAADAAHGVGAAVLFMIRMQDEEDIQRALQRGFGWYFTSVILNIMLRKFPG